MEQDRFYQDPEPTTHQSNRDKNDYLADVLKQLSSSTEVTTIVRVDTEESHGWRLKIIMV